MNRKNLFVILLLLTYLNGWAQTGGLGVFETSADIGKPKLQGSSQYDPASQVYSLKGGGYNIWFQRDEFQYLFRKLKGDFILTANFAFNGKGTDPHRKVGWMIRASEQEDAFLESAPQNLQLALLLGLWTGQRQGDLLRLRWSAFDGTHIRLRQRKTAAYVLVPVGRPLRKMLNAAKAKLSHEVDEELLTILVNSNGAPWTTDGFRNSWRKACKNAGVAGVTFHDLRGTAITRLAIAGCTVPEIATITGHTLQDVAAILDRHYLNPDSQLADNAIRKLEKGARRPTKRPTAG